MIIIELSVVPVGTGSTGVSQFVKTAIEVIKKSGLKYAVNPMGTCIEGEWEKVFSVVKEIHDTLAQMGCARLLTTIKIDDRRDKPQTMEIKVAKVTN